MRFQIACVLLLIAVAACDKKKDDKKEGEGTASGSAEASGSGTASGSELASGSGTAAVAPAVDATPAPPPIPPGMTGDPVCDELIARQHCMFAAMGKNMPKQTIDAFEAGIEAWRTGLAEPTTKDSIIASCKTSLDNAKEGYAQLKCDGAIADLKGQTTDVPKAAGAGGLPAGFTTTGAAECDELSVRTLCTYTKGAGSYPASAVEAFLIGVDSWRKAIANDATRQPTIDGCKASLDGGKDAFASAGCGGDLASLEIAMPTGGGGAPKPATTGGFQPFGEATCDKMVERTVCMYQKMPGGAGEESLKLFLEGVESYRDLLHNDQTRAAVIDGCRSALENGDQGYKSVGC